MNEPPAKPKSFFERVRSLPLKAWVAILVAESVVFIILIVLLVWVVFRG
ncbi:MAG TPA: hypothetical protein VN415_09840 [Dehalococcoidia bacterium]|jgi:hypothetical protein|nr:hypothetical protein [Dehalococcoidia bacterium]